MTKIFQPGDVLTASDVNLFVQLDQLPTRVAASAAERDAIWGAPTSAAARLALQNKGATTIRLDTGITERYYAQYDAATNPAGALAPGWYPPGVMPLASTLLTDLRNGFAGITTAPWAPPRLQVVGGVAHLYGAVTRSTAPAAATVVLVLPQVALAPAYQIRGVNVDITTAGEVICQSAWGTSQAFGATWPVRGI